MLARQAEAALRDSSSECERLNNQVSVMAVELKSVNEKLAAAKKTHDEAIIKAFNDKSSAQIAAQKAKEDAALAKEREEVARREVANVAEEERKAKLDAESWKKSSDRFQVLLERREVSERTRELIVEEPQEDLFYSIWLEHPTQTYQILGPGVEQLLENFRTRKAREDAERGAPPVSPMEEEEAPPPPSVVEMPAPPHQEENVSAPSLQKDVSTPPA